MASMEEGESLQESNSGGTLGRAQGAGEASFVVTMQICCTCVAHQLVCDVPHHRALSAPGRRSENDASASAAGALKKVPAVAETNAAIHLKSPLRHLATCKQVSQSNSKWRK